jgi:hypothetical protein
MTPNTSNSPIDTPPGQEGGLFPPPASMEMCSWNECLAGHKWLATVAIAPCPSCKASVLAVKKENCPYCNEPVSKMSLRSAHIPRGGGLAGRCVGQVGVGEEVDILLERTHWEDAEKEAKFFHER